MSFWRSWMERVTGRADHDLDRELRAHLELEAEEQRESGLPSGEARYAAQRAFGNTMQVKEEVREMWGWTSLETLAQDLRYGLRQLRRSPGFAVVVVATLALGIGANTAIFSVINGVILRPLPFPDPERLAALDERAQTSGGWRSFSYLNFLDCERDSRSFENMAAWRNEGVNLTAPGDPEYVRARQSSASFFSVLGVRPVLGRAFLAEEDKFRAPPVAIISHALWQKRFGGDPQAIGSRVILNGKALTIVGVLPPGFRYYGNRHIFTPI